MCRSAAGAYFQPDMGPRPVLVVDDDPDIRETLRFVLEDAGYPVYTAENGREALEVLADAQPLPGLILLDLMMPVMNGWQLRMELLKDQRLARIPVVVISGAANVESEARALGAAGYLAKPILEFAPLFSLLDSYR